MSASQDKKRRQSERAAGTSPKTLAEREAELKSKKERRTWTIVGVIVAVFVILVIVLNTNLFYTGTTAMTIGDYEFTNAEYQYYYNTAYNNFVSQYGSIAGYLGLDTNSDLKDQTMNTSMVEMLGLTLPDSLTGDDAPEEITWADYFRETALQNMVQVTAIWDAATKAGYTLSEEDSASIDDINSNYATLAEQNNLRGADGYIALAYGKGVDSALVRELLERGYIAESYSTDVFEGFEYTADELNSYYDENADAFDALSFDYYLVRAETEEVTETVTDEETGEETEETNDRVTEATMADAKEIADGIAAAVEGGADFAETVSGEIEDAEITQYENAFGYSVSSNFADDFSEWVLDGSRQAGDVAVIESADTGYYVVVFHSRNDNSSYNGVSFRHILIQVDDADEDGEISDEERQSAEDKINEIYSDWQDNEATEDSFAELANTYSDDSRSNGSSTYGSSGGLYEHVAVNQMVDGINDWIFDSERQPGDTEIIYVEASNYTGYHLVYFVGTDDYNYHDCLAQYGLGSAGAPGGLRQQDYTAWEDELFAQFPVSINGFINWFAKV